MKDVFSNAVSQNQFIFKNEKMNIELWLKREDLLHPFISGNKFRKLKYNLQEAKNQGKKSLLTFGGAFSNHIAATAAAGKLAGMETIGVIRGEELGNDLQKTLQQNPTLHFAAANGMKFHFISREQYREKASEAVFLNLKKRFGNFYLVPEGGTNMPAVNGCEEILVKEDQGFDFICCAVGTGGTISGIVNASSEKQKVIGFPALKGDFLNFEIKKYTNKANWELVPDYHFGGYAKISAELVEFINFFKLKNNVQLDPVYTGKMMYGIMQMIGNGKFPPNTRILAIHTGGVQGIAGMNKLLKKKNLPMIL